MKIKPIPDAYQGSRWDHIFITLKPFLKHAKLKFPHRNIKGLDSSESILYWALGVGPDVKLELLKPPTVDKHVWDDFEEIVERAILVRNSVLSIYADMQHVWEYNCLLNLERFKNAKSVDDLPAPVSNTDFAFVVGNGPSLSLFLAEQNYPVGKFFSCWHAVPKLLARKPIPINPDLVGHIDAIPPYQDEFETPYLYPSTRIVACPSVAPEFLAEYKDNPLYAYMGMDRAIHGAVSKVLDLPCHRDSEGTISHTMTMCAILAGFKKIVLVGVDLADLNPKGYIFQKTNPVNALPLKRINKHGETVYTNQAFEACVGGLQLLPERYADITFYNYSKIGLDLAGYKEWEDC